MTFITDWLIPSFAGFIAGIIPGAVALGAVRQKIKDHYEEDDTRFAQVSDNFGKIDDRLRHGDVKMDAMKELLVEMRTDIKWIKGKKE